MAENVTSPVMSPVIKKRVPIQSRTMDFFEALKEVAAGKKITRVEWDNPGIYGALKENLLVIHGGRTGDDKDHSWIISDGDLLSEDWRVL